MPIPESVPVGAGGERLPSEEKREAPSLKGLEEDFEERREVYRSPSPGDDFINMSDRESSRERERQEMSLVMEIHICLDWNYFSMMFVSIIGSRMSALYRMSNTILIY